MGDAILFYENNHRYFSGGINLQVVLVLILINRNMIVNRNH